MSTTWSWVMGSGGVGRISIHLALGAERHARGSGNGGSSSARSMHRREPPVEADAHVSGLLTEPAPRLLEALPGATDPAPGSPRGGEETRPRCAPALPAPGAGSPRRLCG